MIRRFIRAILREFVSNGPPKDEVVSICFQAKKAKIRLSSIYPYQVSSSLLDIQYVVGHMWSSSLNENYQSSF